MDAVTVAGERTVFVATDEVLSMAIISPSKASVYHSSRPRPKTISAAYLGPSGSVSAGTARLEEAAAGFRDALAGHAVGRPAELNRALGINFAKPLGDIDRSRKIYSRSGRVATAFKRTKDRGVKPRAAPRRSEHGKRIRGTAPQRTS